MSKSSKRNNEMMIAKYMAIAFVFLMVFSIIGLVYNNDNQTNNSIETALEDCYLPPQWLNNSGEGRTNEEIINYCLDPPDKNEN